MGGTFFIKLTKISGLEKSQNRPVLAIKTRVKNLASNILRKIEQSPTEYCQYSEYLTLLNSFPDVKESV
jgi:hypothetical protein